MDVVIQTCVEINDDRGVRILAIIVSSKYEVAILFLDVPEKYQRK